MGLVRGGRGPLFVWHLDRFWRSATWCALGAWGLLAGVGFAVDAVSDVERVLGGLLVGALIVALGALVGSIATAACGTLMVGIVAGLAKPGVWTLAVVGIAVVLALVLVDLSVTLRRAPTVDARIGATTLATAVGLSVAGAAGATTAWFLATRAEWQAILLPLGFIAIGLAMRLAVDRSSPSRPTGR